MTRALDLTSEWPVPTVAAAAIHKGTVVDAIGPGDHLFRLASISKTITAWVCLIGVEEGIIDLADPVGPDDGTGRTLRHVLAHAGGYGFEADDRIIEPEKRRIYGNAGIEVAADHLANAAGMPFGEYLQIGVLDPLDMAATDLRGSPAHQMWSSVDDLARFIGETTQPTLISAETAAVALRPHFPTLGGIVPGVGRFDTCPWGLGFEIKGDKAPHWTGTRNTPDTYGHFGGAGTMMWVDPGHDRLGMIALTDRGFDEWADDALRCWPEISDAVIEEFTGAS
ncbi:serine hydrolase domain-containing protein [Ilumatobacter sp.]|uniref:serine hydrolase domain-containing protein n=1 Tax=Ilumatobacter sp. TaxID=1967498 RepID=UPI003C6A5D74